MQAALAQEVRGSVVDSASRQPLVGVTVILLGSPGDSALARAQTTARGDFLIEAPSPGPYRVRFEMPGFRQAVTSVLELSVGRVMEVSPHLTPLPAVVLDTVLVAGQRVPYYLADFYRRREEGFGDFLTRAQIERYWPHRTTDVVRRLPGFEIVYGGDGSRTIRSLRAPRFGQQGVCSPVIFVDGAYVGSARTFDLDSNLWAENLVAVEAYPSPATMPVIFNVTGSECGGVAFWTKR